MSVQQRHLSIPVTAPVRGWVGRCLILSAMLFNLLLCFVNTRLAHVNLPVIAGCQMLIVVSASAIVWRELLFRMMIPGVLFAIWSCVLFLLSPGFDVKTVVEITSIAVFFCLGLELGAANSADRFVFLLVLLVFAFGLFENMFLDVFESLFNILGYYVDKGTLDAGFQGTTGTTLFENGMRSEGEGRQLLPGLLGLHRVGSIFLEPISAGNFSTICTGWVCARRDWSWRGLLTIILSFAITVLADTRFGAFSSLAVVLVLVLPLWRSRLLVASLPLLTVAGLLIVASAVPLSDSAGNSFAGRVLGSGLFLLKWSWADWIGLAGRDGISPDVGYSYLIGGFGLICALALWIAAARRREPNAEAERFFAAISVYGALGLTISASFFSIKTAALMWYLYGAIQRTEAPGYEERTTEPMFSKEPHATGSNLPKSSGKRRIASHSTAAN